MTTLMPETDSQLIDTVRWAVAEGQPLEIRGRGTKAGFGRPVQAAHTLDLSRLTGIVSYEPEELVLVARPGTPMAEIRAALAERGQALAFEPPDLSPLFGTGTDGGSIGGVVSTGLSGPRRIAAGAVRDHVLGIAAVSGRGELFRAGARVVKNVTGYDLPKLLTGAFGTLGVITEVTLKVLPAAEMVRTLVLAGVAAADGVAALTAALGSPAEVSGAAWVPADLSFPHLPDRTPCALLRLEGPAVSVAARLAHLERLLDGRAAMAVLDGAESGDLWAALRDATPFAERPDLTIWKLSVPPAAGPAVLDRVKAEWPRAKAWADWGGGLIWLGLQGADAKGVDARGADAQAAAVRAAIGPTGGHGTLVRAPDSVRVAIPVFHPQLPALAALTARIRAQFDPAGILNPGRMTL